MYPAADDYQRHYNSVVAGALARLAGFRGARLLRRHDGDRSRRCADEFGGRGRSLFATLAA